MSLQASVIIRGNPVKNPTAIEKVGMMLGAVIFFVGLLTVVWPQPGAIRFSTNGALGMQQQLHVQGVTKTGARFYGVILERVSSLCHVIGLS
jgi:hypothetical protein